MPSVFLQPLQSLISLKTLITLRTFFYPTSFPILQIIFNKVRTRVRTITIFYCFCQICGIRVIRVLKQFPFSLRPRSDSARLCRNLRCSRHKLKLTLSKLTLTSLKLTPTSLKLTLTLLPTNADFARFNADGVRNSCVDDIRVGIHLAREKIFFIFLYETTQIEITR